LMSLLPNGVEEVSFLFMVIVINSLWDAEICWLCMQFLCLYLLEMWLLFFM
jgi:hypothetical protein